MSAKILSIRLAGIVIVALAQACGGSGGSTGAPVPHLQKAASASGDGQTGTISTALANPLRVLVTVDGAPKSGETVTWSTAVAGASVSPTSSITDGAGIASTAWTLGTLVGSESATATLAGAVGSPVTFTATASAAPVPLIAMTATASGDGQSGTVGDPLANPLRVQVTLSGVAQQGVSVSWAATGTGGAVTPSSSLTDASGIASTTWTLAQAAGSQTATATLAGANGSPVTFGATAAARAAATLALAGGDGQTGSPNVALPTPLSVLAADQFANPVSGVGVTWQVTGGTGSVNPTSSSTGANGTAQTVLTLGATPGAVTVTATSGSLSGSPVTFHATISLFATSAGVSVGDNFFKSGHNNTQNPAVDTVGVGGTVTWTWAGANPHSVESTGSPSFTSSTVKTSGTYAFTFNAAGTYTYDCAVHGAAMTGTVVVR